MVAQYRVETVAKYRVETVAIVRLVQILYAFKI